MTILLVDDHPIVLQGMRTLMAQAFPAARILTATQAGAAERLLQQAGADLVVVDLELDGESGLALLQRLRSLRPDAGAIVYTMHEEPWTVREILEADPDAVVMKGDRTDELVTAARAVSEGRAYYSPSFCRRLSQMSSQPAPLTDRERQILALTAAGQSTAAIATALCITASTVEFHRRRIMRKLGAANAAEMVSKAAAMGWRVLDRPERQA